MNEEAALEFFVSRLGVAAQSIAIFVAAAGFAAAVVGWLLWKKTDALDKLKDERIRQAEQQLQSEIRTAGVRIEEAKLAAAKANLRTERLKQDNLELEKLNNPRDIVFERDTLEKLNRFAETPVMIQSVPDFEAQKFAEKLAALLNAAGWKVDWESKDLKSSPIGRDMVIPDDVTILTRVGTEPPLNDPDAPDKRWGMRASEAVYEVLKLSNVYAKEQGTGHVSSLTWRGIAIQVGLRSAMGNLVRRAIEDWKEKVRLHTEGQGEQSQ